MLTVVSDTHSHEGHRLAGRTYEAVATADCVVHAGDFVTGSVLDAFESVADRFEAVTGNSDTPAVRERLPEERVVEYEGFRIAVTHGHRRGETQLSLFARQSMADLLVVGHTHRPEFGHVGEVPTLNPGSHAHPRGNRPGHAELRAEGGTLVGELVDPDGTVFREFRVEAA